MSETDAWLDAAMAKAECKTFDEFLAKWHAPYDRHLHFWVRNNSGETAVIKDARTGERLQEVPYDTDDRIPVYHAPSRNLQIVTRNYTVSDGLSYESIVLEPSGYFVPEIIVLQPPRSAKVADVQPDK